MVYRQCIYMYIPTCMCGCRCTLHSIYRVTCNIPLAIICTCICNTHWNTHTCVYTWLSSHLSRAWAGGKCESLPLFSFPRHLLASKVCHCGVGGTERPGCRGSGGELHSADIWSFRQWNTFFCSCCSKCWAMNVWVPTARVLLFSLHQQQWLV